MYRKQRNIAMMMDQKNTKTQGKRRSSLGLGGVFALLLALGSFLLPSGASLQLLAPAVYAAPSLSYQVDKTKVMQGDTVGITIALSEAQTLDAIQMYIDYDQDSFEFVPGSSWLIDATMEVSDSHTILDDASAGLVSMIHWQKAVSTDVNGVVAYLTFKAKKDAPVTPAIFTLAHSANNVASFVSSLENGKITADNAQPIKVEVNGSGVAEKPKSDKPLPPSSKVPALDSHYEEPKAGIKTNDLPIPAPQGNGYSRSSSGNVRRIAQKKGINPLHPIAPVPEEDEEEATQKVRGKSGKVSKQKEFIKQTEEAEFEDESEHENFIDEAEQVDAQAHEEAEIAQAEKAKLYDYDNRELFVPNRPLPQHRIPQGYRPKVLLVKEVEIQGYVSEDGGQDLYYLEDEEGYSDLYTYSDRGDYFELYQADTADDGHDASKVRAKSFAAESEKKSNKNLASIILVALIGISSFSTLVISIIRQIRP